MSMRLLRGRRIAAAHAMFGRLCNHGDTRQGEGSRRKPDRETAKRLMNRGKIVKWATIVSLLLMIGSVGVLVRGMTADGIGPVSWMVAEGLAGLGRRGLGLGNISGGRD